MNAAYDTREYYEYIVAVHVYTIETAQNFP